MPVKKPSKKLIKKPSKKLIKICKRLKIKLTRKSKSGKRVYKSVKQLMKEVKKKKPSNFIKKANERSIKKGTVGAFKKWCKSKGLTNKSGKVTMKCVKYALKDKSVLVRRRANYARNIGGYSKRTSIGVKHSAFGIIDQERFNRYSASGWIVPQSDFTKRSWTRVKRNCEDGESGILNNKIIPGMYVNLGHKKCLSVQEVLQMHSMNRFVMDDDGNILNPFTRQPLTRKQLIKLNDIIAASGILPPINHFPRLPDYDDDDESMDTPTYMEALMDVMMSGTLTEPELKEAFDRFASMEDYLHLANLIFTELPRDLFWRIHNNKLQFKRNIILGRSSGWIDMDEIFEDELISKINEVATSYLQN